MSAKPMEGNSANNKRQHNVNAPARAFPWKGRAEDGKSRIVRLNSEAGLKRIELYCGRAMAITAAIAAVIK